MGLRPKYRRAIGIINRLGHDECATVEKICRRIRSAQENLQHSALPLMQRCIEHCGGICCRNVEIDAIISHWDFVYILTLRPDLGPLIERHLENEHPIFTSNCCFLTDGVGPCLFPSNLRPEVCITTFCGDERPVKTDVRRLKRHFLELTRFIRRRRLHGIMRTVMQKSLRFEV